MSEIQTLITFKALDLALVWSEIDEATKDDLTRILLFNPTIPHALTDFQRQLRKQIVDKFSLDEIALAANYPPLRAHAINMNKNEEK